MIPAFTDEGFLPEGIHETSWDELQTRYGTTAHRKRLLAGLRHALSDLALAGCKAVYIDGSFITTKATPGDFDACWDEEDVDWDALDETLLTFDNARAAQKLKYSGELFPMTAHADPWGNRFIDFFQVDKYTQQPKGILKLSLEQWQA
jgi:hypothetical protein